MEVGYPVQDELCLGVLKSYSLLYLICEHKFFWSYKKKSLREKVEEPSRGRGFERGGPLR